MELTLHGRERLRDVVAQAEVHVLGKHLAQVPTVFDRLDESLCRALVHRGWWLTGAALAMYHPARLGDAHSFTAPAT